LRQQLLRLLLLLPLLQLIGEGLCQAKVLASGLTVLLLHTREH
jgi:hypothetical protein